MRSHLDLPLRRALTLVLAAAALLFAAAPVRAATADVGISFVAPPTARVGDDFGTMLTITNAGPDPAADIEVSDPLASAFILVSVTTDRGTCDAGPAVACHLGILAPGESALIDIRAVPVSPGRITITAGVASPDDSTSDDNSAVRTISVAGPTCTVIGTTGPDVLVPTDGVDVLCGLGGNDTIDAGTGDHALGGDGEDILRAVAGGAVLDGARGNDTITGGAGADLLRGGTADDTITAGAGDDYLDGGLGTDVLTAGEGVDTCTETGSSCYLTSPTDVRETGALVDVRAVTTTFGRTATFVFQTWKAWSVRDLEERGWFVVRFDTMSSSLPDYAAVVRVHRGVMSGALFRIGSGAARVVTSVRVRRLSSSRISVAVPITRMERDATRPTYRWGASSLWLSSACSRTVCLDGVPAPTAFLRQPVP